MGTTIFVTGGARSGKSRFAEERAAGSGQPVTYLATMQAGDDELAARIQRHRERRPGVWGTVEAPIDVLGALESSADGDTVLLDCLSLWVSNLLFAATADHGAWAVDDWERFVTGAVEASTRVIEAQQRRAGTLIVVTNETGMGIVPADALSRYYRDALGLVNQAFATPADEAYLLVGGLPLRLK